MVILIEKYGKHSNRLFQHIHFESFCREYNIKFLNLTFSDMAKYYNVKSSFLFPVLNMFLLVLAHLRLIKVHDFYKENDMDTYKNVLLKRGTHFVVGWHFKVHSLTKKYQYWFAGKFSPAKKYYQHNKFARSILELDRTKLSIVGIHVRRGDYLTWENGRYFYDDDTYISFIEATEKEIMLKSGKQAFFIIFSNVNASFGEKHNIVVSNNSWTIDHLLMSKCDYLIGPPSSFTLWASFIGKTKYMHIYHKDQEIDLDKFQVCHG